MTRFVIRPIREDDFPLYRDLAFSVRGMTSLPKDDELLHSKIRNSLRAFDERTHKPGGESYLFVLEDRDTQKMAGVSGIISKVGGFEPFYSYKIKQETLYSKVLKVKRDIKVLHLSINHNGPTEICSLLLNPQYRTQGLGRLLSLSRFHFIVAFPQRFDKEVISEMRGVIGTEGQPPFWECVGRHFFDTDFFKADHLCSLGNKDFIAELMPKYPIYFELLPQSAKDVVGKVHDDTKPALKLLTSEGFRFYNEVDIFDAGPTLKARFDDLRTIKFTKVALLTDFEEGIESLDYLVSNGRLDYRACVGAVKEIPEKGVMISSATAEVLKLKRGDELRYVLLR